MSEAFCVPDLQEERQQCSFAKEEITDILDGGGDNTKMRRSLEAYFLNDERFKDVVPPEYLSHSEKYKNELRKACAMVDCIHNDPAVQNIVGQMEGIRMLMGSGLGMALTKDGNPLALHYVMFLPALVGQATPEQLSQWMGKAWNGEIVGTYAQTELGHGTYLRGLETTATYVPETETFILNSPTISSLKWWPGGLGKTATHAVVMAQLYTNGNCYGPHAFLVQLRDLETHQSMPGITVGEIGPRLGMNTNDNGFLKMDQVTIPRDQMLMQHAQVSKCGEYHKPASTKLAYGTMVFVRVAICFDAGRQLQRAVTIAVRYSAVRRQGKINPQEDEVKILEYQTQQHKLLPQIAAVFAVIFAARNAWTTYNDVSQNITDGNLQRLPELHALSCGLKAACSTDCTAGVEFCRLSCGGHGYLSSSNFPRILTTTTASQTYEGENTVMWLQLARYLVKAYNDRSCGTLAASVAYFASPPRKSAAGGHLSDQGLLKGWQASTVELLTKLLQKMESITSSGEHPDVATNRSSLLAVQAAEVFIAGHMCAQFVESVANLEGSISAGTCSILRQLCRLYLLHQTLRRVSAFMMCGWLSSADVHALQEEYSELLASLRPQAVNLVDAFDIEDRILDSTLGCFDGKVYERIYEAALKSPLNQKDVADGYHQHLRPLMKSNL